MKTSHQIDFKTCFLELEETGKSTLTIWRYDHPLAACEENGDIILTLGFKALDPAFAEMEVPVMPVECRLRAYGNNILRFLITADKSAFSDGGPMLDLHDSVTPVGLTLEETGDCYQVRGPDGNLRASFDRQPIMLKGGSQDGDTVSAAAMLSGDGEIEVPFMCSDYFSKRPESLPLAFLQEGDALEKALFAFHASPDERFAGTGERFRHLDLAGGTYSLQNTDALGSNNRRCYKNVPFYLSSRPYGLFLHTTCHMRLSLADISTRAAQGVIDEPRLDGFLIGGSDWERILFNYRCLTGFPPELPVWTFGTWMSRSSYTTADEVREVANRLRAEDFPCDVIHLDTGWFKHNWVCDWKFSEERFPDAPAFVSELLQKGFRTSVWQTPYIGKWNPIAEAAAEKGVLGTNPVGQAHGTSESHFSADPDTELAYIDFSNPEAVSWYQEELLRPLLEMGVATIKTDFGEDIDMQATYHGIDAAKLHNVYNLLYHRAAADITESIHGHRLVFARSTWAGSQRYPVHWGGDTASSWDGLAGVLRGGLHLGLSGFAYWSHDVGGFYGIPDFMSDRPDPILFLRWAQMGVLSSHLRFHGTTPREPYEYPEVAPILRMWLKLRYALIPYIRKQANLACASGTPLLAPLVLRHPEDPACWHLDDQYYFGEDLLVAPILNSSGQRSVYLPEGTWIELWTGQCHSGGKYLREVSHSLETIPVFVREGSSIPIHGKPVASTGDMDPDHVSELVIDKKTFSGFASSKAGQLCGF